MKKTMKILFGMVFMLMCGLYLQPHTPAKAGCYYQQTHTTYSNTDFKPEHIKVSNAKVWRYETSLARAVTKAQAGTTIYINGGNAVNDTQVIFNKNLTIRGLKSNLSWKTNSGDGFIQSKNCDNTGYEWVHIESEPFQNMSSLYFTYSELGSANIQLKADASRGTGDAGKKTRFGSDKLDPASEATSNVYGASLMVNKNYTLNLRDVLVSGMCGSSNNPSTLLMLNGGNCNLENVRFENNNWYTFQGKKGYDKITTAANGQVSAGIGNPGGAITVIEGGKCTVRRVGIFNCHSYMTGGGVHVSGSGSKLQLLNGESSSNKSIFEIKDCSGSSGGALSAISGGEIELIGGSNVECNFSRNYVEPAAYDANENKGGNAVGYSANSIHVGSGSKISIGYNGTSFEIAEGGKSNTSYGSLTSAQYAQIGIPDSGNIVVKGTFITDGGTYIHDGDGAVAGEVYVTGENAVWKYGRNGTTTCIRKASGEASNYSMSLRKQGKPVCYKTNLTNGTICSVIKNDKGSIQKEHANSKLLVKAGINTSNCPNPRTIVYLRNGAGSHFQGSLEKSNSSNTRPFIVGSGASTDSGCSATMENMMVSGFTAGTREEDLLVSNGSSLYLTGTLNTIKSDVTSAAGAQTMIWSSTNFDNHYVQNYGETSLGNTTSQAVISNAKLDSYGSTDKLQAWSEYETYLNNNPHTGLLSFFNNETVGCQLRLFGGVVKFLNAGQYNTLGRLDYDSGAVFMCGDNIKMESDLSLNGDSANLTVKNCRGTTGYRKNVVNKKGLVELADKGKIVTLVNGSKVEIQDADCRVSELSNCGFGKVYQKNGHVTKLYNGRYKSVDDKSTQSDTSFYYHSGGSIDPDGVTPASFTNYGRYYGGSKECKDVTGVKVLAPVVNYNVMRLGNAKAPSSVTTQIGETGKRNSVINHGTIRNIRGKIYASFLSNYDTVYNQNPEEPENVACIINCEDDINNNEGEIKSYSGIIKANKFTNKATTLIRGTSFSVPEIVNEKNASFHVLNPLLPEQTTRLTSPVENKGTLTMDNEVTDASSDLKPSLDKITGSGTIKLNSSDVENSGAIHRAMEVTIENDNPDKVTSENKKLEFNKGYADPSLYWETSGNLELGPGVTIPKGIKNNHTIKVTYGTIFDNASNLSRTLPTKVKAVENNGTFSSVENTKILLTGEDQDGSLYTNVGKTTTLKGAIVSDKNKVQIVNQSGATTKLMHSGLTGSETDSGYKGQVVNNGGSVVLGAKGSEEFRVNNTNINFSSISNNGGTTTIKNGGVSEGSVIDAVYVSDGQVVLDDTDADMLYNKKIQVTLDDSKGTWKEGKPAILDNSTITKYMLNLDRYANDTLVCKLKVPFSKISNGDRLKNWSQYISASKNRLEIEKRSKSDTENCYTLSTHREKDTLPEDDTVYLTLLDNTPPEITFDGSKNKYVEVDCRAGSHSTEYLPLQVKDDITGVKWVKVEVTNTDSGEKRTKTFSLNSELTPSIPEESILSLHNDDEKESFGNLKVKVTAEDAAGNQESASKEVMAGRISIVIEDKFKDSQSQSGNPYCYWNFIKVGEDEYKENIGAWLAGDQKWLTVKLEGFWDKVSFGYKNTQGVIEMKDVMDNPNQWDVEKSSYKTINGKKNGKHVALTVPLKAKHKDLNFTGTIVTEKEGAHGKDKKTFTYELNTLKKVSIENSIEKRILQQNTQLPDGRWTDGLQIFPK